MNKFKLNLIFSAPPRSTGWYFVKAFKELGIDVEHFGHGNPITRLADFNLLIDAGAYVRRGDISHPNGYLAIDNHLMSDRHVSIVQSLDCDIIFSAQINTQNKLKEVFPNKPILWLPNACDPEVHKNKRPYIPLRPKFSGFIGGIDQYFRGRRRNILDIAEKINSNSNLMRINEFPHEQMSDVLSECIIGINECSLDDINMRTFEIPSCGCLLFTNYIPSNGYEDLGFEDFVNCIYWHDEEHFREKLTFINNDIKTSNGMDYYTKIARNGYLLATKSCTYQHRAKTILSQII